MQVDALNREINDGDLVLYSKSNYIRVARMYKGITDVHSSVIKTVTFSGKLVTRNIYTYHSYEDASGKRVKKFYFLVKIDENLEFDLNQEAVALDALIEKKK